MEWNARILLFGAGFVAGWGGAAIAAQDAGIRTLHVYENLIQIPVLVLDPLRAPLEPIAPRRFAISVDSGPRFRPTHIRQEGDDPISLSILLDASGPENDLLPTIVDVSQTEQAQIGLQTDLAPFGRFDICHEWTSSPSGPACVTGHNGRK